MEVAPSWLGPTPLGRVVSAFAIATLLVHYYVERYLWQFRLPHVRASLAPYLARSG
jgi:hypothetical protein